MVYESKTRLSVADFYALPAYAAQDTLQLIDGEVIDAMPPIPRHQAIVGEILVLLVTLARKLGGQAFTAPLEVYLDEHNIFQPDVLYLAPNSACTVEEKRLVGPPELVVEVLSPSTAKYDRHEKYLAYERHGVREYWIVDPLHDVVEVWQQQDQGGFRRVGAYGRGDSFTSATLGQAVTVASLLGT